MNKVYFNKGIIIGIILLFVGASIVPSISGNFEISNKNETSLINNSSINSPEDWIERQIIQSSDGEADDIFSRSVSINDDYAVIGAVRDDDNGKNSGSAYVYKREGILWKEEAKLIASDGEPWSSFGVSNSISGDYIIIGAEDYGNSGNGSAYIFKRDERGWYEQAILTASDGGEGDWFGYSVSISGDYALVGAGNNDVYGEDSGSAYLFKRDGSNWYEIAILHASDSENNTFFGCSVSLDGDYALIGASGADAAYVFKRDGLNWYEEDLLIPSDGVPDDLFGYSVSIDGDYAIIGAPDHDQQIGAAYVFKRFGSSWMEDQKIIPSVGEDDVFGGCVTISGDYALVGAPFYYGSTGCAYVFKHSGSSWIEEQILTASDGEINNYFGSDSTINGNYILCGSYIDNSKGAAYFFEKLDPNAPYAPIIKGPASGKTGEELEYTFNTDDPNGDDVKYHIFWGDGDSDTTIFYNSGSNVKVKHFWSEGGEYTIKAATEDTDGLFGPWSTFEITMPRNIISFKTIVQRHLDRFPNLFQIIRLLLQRMELQ